MIGFLVVDKEAGWTSHDVVARCRRILSERRIGHAGTLDPGATGVLVIGVGRATRLLRYVSGVDKEYRGEVVLGATTTTLDEDGEVLERFDMAGVTLDDVRCGCELVDRRDRPDGPDGLGGQGGRAATPQAGPGRHRGGAPGAPGHGRAVGGDRGRPSRGPSACTSLVPRAPTSGSWRPISVRLSAGVRTCGGCAAPGSARSSNPMPRPSKRSKRRSPRWTTRRFARPSTRSATWAKLTVTGAVRTDVAHGRPLDRSVIGASGAGPFALVDHAGELLAVYEGRLDDDTVRASVVLRPA